VANPMKELAEDLDKLLLDAKPKPVIPPSVTEKHDVREVSRAILDYVLHRAPENAVTEDIGFGLAEGIKAAASELSLKEADLLKGLEDLTTEILKAARESLAPKKR